MCWRNGATKIACRALTLNCRSTAPRVLLVVCYRSVRSCPSVCLGYSDTVLVLQRTLPHNCPYDNVYCLFPFVVPEESKTYVENLPDQKNQKKYKVNRPKQAKIKILRTLKGISEVLNDPKIYASPYKQNLIELTGGYGWECWQMLCSLANCNCNYSHMLGFDDLPL